ncbi:hypothetical protein DBR11_05920 [Pedobacter sp. HMWF019]|uniref:S41 family peptidase n=1 Tax=Pedobacter sp. HMWF019 TaxID=2056856 RepID=UPI000D37A360|nr:S41 family peptidase [Pedobacter sp. HMWF019]PTT02032.1 hypothetical protein DBR11_05920 [Pedobacter sp. HMWF019]
MKSDLSYGRFGLCCLFVLSLGVSSCKKNHTTEPSTTDPITTGVPTTGTRTELTLDSLYLYAKQIYFWSDALPEYAVFNPRKYSGKSLALDNYDDELYAISQLKINPLTNKPYEYEGDGFPKYSFISDITQANPSPTSNLKTANVDTEGNGFDIGIRPVFYLTSNSAPRPYFLFVTAVYPGSPAATAGVKRGWLIQKVNGKTVGSSYDSESASVSASLAGTSVTLEGINYIDKVPFSVTLNKASYKSSPVYTSKVISRSGKKIGYLAFARFSNLTVDSNNPSDVNLDPVFTSFVSGQVTDLVVDLRYNGGGYVNTAEYLANLIAPSTTTGQKMFTEIYNSLMQTNKATILSHQPALDNNGKVQYSGGKMVTLADLDYSTTAAQNNASFAKKGGLSSVSNIVFIVSRNTASASELLINSLKPYMNVKLVGDTTYGKPVGFFPIRLENRYDVYMSLFETRNARNEGGYYTGMVPDKLDEYDDPTRPFGDEQENYLSLALDILAPTAKAASQSTVMSVGGKSLRTDSFHATQSKQANPRSEFMGMIERRGRRTK